MKKNCLKNNENEVNLVQVTFPYEQGTFHEVISRIMD